MVFIGAGFIKEKINDVHNKNGWNTQSEVVLIILDWILDARNYNPNITAVN